MTRCVEEGLAALPAAVGDILVGQIEVLLGVTFAGGSWVALLAPVRTPDAVVAKIAIDTDRPRDAAWFDKPGQLDLTPEHLGLAISHRCIGAEVVKRAEVTCRAGVAAS
jgi:hypothetical protein